MLNIRSLALGTLLLAVPPLLRADPIKCIKAATPTEKTICSDISLVQLDAKMDTEYGIALRFLAMGSASDQRDQQRAFPGQRNTCGADKACIRATYNKRIATFEATIQHAQTFGPF